MSHDRLAVDAELDHLARMVLAALADREPKPTAGGLLALLHGLRATSQDCAPTHAGGRSREGAFRPTRSGEPFSVSPIVGAGS